MGKRLKPHLNLPFLAFLAWMATLLTIVAVLNK